MDPSPGQLRAARAWLGWNLEEAADASRLHAQTIHRIEAGLSPGSRQTIRALVQAYAKNGIWMDDGMIKYDAEAAKNDPAAAG